MQSAMEAYRGALVGVMDYALGPPNVLRGVRARLFPGPIRCWQRLLSVGADDLSVIDRDSENALAAFG